MEQAIADLDAIGVRRTASQGTEDVTSQVVDIDARLVTAQASLDRVRKLLGERRMALAVSEPAKEFLARAGWDPTYGARPLKRAIQHELQDPLALKILQGEFHEGQTIAVGADDSHLTFAPAAETELIAA
jgi:ATP-dependent Clp protease ATP-binding subunit ClpB